MHFYVSAVGNSSTLKYRVFARKSLIKSENVTRRIDFITRQIRKFKIPLLDLTIWNLDKNMCIVIFCLCLSIKWGLLLKAK